MCSSDLLTGKRAGNDIKEKKITLPLIRALEMASSSKRREIMSVVRKKKKTRDEIDEVISFVVSSGGLEYAEVRMNGYRDGALAILDSYPESEIKESLKSFVYYTTSRGK